MGKQELPRKKGATRMRELGYIQVVLWLDPEEARRIKYAIRGVPLATEARRLLCEVAKIPFRRR